MILQAQPPDQSWLAAIITSSDDAIISKTTAGVITSWNHAAQQMFGYSEKEAIGQLVTMLFPEDRLDEEQMILTRIAAGEQVRHFETERVRKDGSRIPLSVTISPIRDEHGRIVGASKIARDITRQKDLQARLQTMNNALEERVRERTLELEVANQEMEAFIHAISHDLRAPLRALAGFSKELTESCGDQLPQAGNECLEQILKASTRMTELVNGLMDLSRNTGGALVREFTDVALLAASSWNTLKTGIGRVDGGVPMLSINCPHRLYGDPRMLRSLFNNLLENALKYSARAAQPTVSVYQEQDPSGVTWTCIADNGVGFEMRESERMFHPFQRLHAAHDFPGLGLGLATVKRIVLRHGGRIEGTSTPGEGACFRFHLGLPEDGM